MATAKNAVTEEVKNNKVRIYVAPDNMNPKEPLEGHINGRFFRIKRGEVVEVPADIADWLLFSHIAQEIK